MAIAAIAVAAASMDFNFMEFLLGPGAKTESVFASPGTNTLTPPWGKSSVGGAIRLNMGLRWRSCRRTMRERHHAQRIELLPPPSPDGDDLLDISTKAPQHWLIYTGK